MVPEKLQFEGSSALRTPAAEVTVFDDELKQLVLNMHHTMQLYDGVGLAAPQVNISKRIVIFNFAPLVMINPNIINVSGSQTLREGCLSFPNLFFDITRPNSVTVEWQTVDGVLQRGQFNGLEATAIQHEIDHLNGKLFVDYVSSRLVLLEKKKLQVTRKGPKR